MLAACADSSSSSALTCNMAPDVKLVIAWPCTHAAGPVCRLPAAALRAPTASSAAAVAATNTNRSMHNPPVIRGSFPLERWELGVLTGLLAFEVWLLLADEGHNADHRVLGHRRATEVFGFDFIALSRGPLEPRDQCFLGEPHRDGGRLGKPSSALEHRGMKSLYG